MGEDLKIRIMAVDDEPTVLDPLKIMLEARGYEVLAIEDSREALKRLENEKRATVSEVLTVGISSPDIPDHRRTQSMSQNSCICQKDPRSENR